MSDKATKKLRKFYRNDIHDQFMLIKQALRPKPVWVPLFVWKILLRIVFRRIGRHLDQI